MSDPEERDVFGLEKSIRAWKRNLHKQETFEGGTIADLAAGMARAILIVLWVDDELGFDRFHANADKIYRAVIEQRDVGAFEHYAVTPRALGRTLKEEVPEVTRASRFMKSGIRFKQKDLAVAERGAFVDPDFLRMFGLPLLQEDADSALKDPVSIVLTESLAKENLGGEDSCRCGVRGGAR